MEDRVAALESAGLKPAVMDVEAMAVMSAYELMAEALPAKGSTRTSGTGRWAPPRRGFMFSAMTSRFSCARAPWWQSADAGNPAAYNMTNEEAEAAKRSGNLPANYDNDVLRPYVDTLAIEAARVLQFFLTSSAQGQVDHMLLAGGCAALPGLADAVSRRTNVVASVANPFFRDGLSGCEARQLAADAQRFWLPAVELAMRRFDARFASTCCRTARQKRARKREFNLILIGT